MKLWIISALGHLLVDILILKPHRIMSHHPLLSVGLILLTSLSISLPLAFKEIQSDADFLFSERYGRATTNLHKLKRLFPMNLSLNFDEGRLVQLIKFGRVIAETKDGLSLFRPEVFNELLDLDKKVKEMVVKKNGLEYRYSNICAKKRGDCYKNDVLSLFPSQIKAMSQGIYSIPYPYEINVKQNFHFHFLGQGLGGVEVDEKRNVKSAHVAGLLYFLASEDESIIIQWQLKFAEELLKLPLKHLQINVLTNEVLKKEYNATILYISLLGAIMGIVALVVLLAIHRPKKAELFLLLLGVGAAILAGLAAIGVSIFVFCWQFSLVQLGIIFILLTISLIDFLYLGASWRKLSHLGSEVVLNSLAPCMLITSLGLMTLYGLIALLPFRAAQLVALPWALASLLHLSFQNAAFTIWASFQHKPDEPITSVVVVEESSKKHHPAIIWVVALVWITYFAFSVLGVQNTKTYLDPSYFYRPSSDVYQSLMLEKKYFADFLYRIHVVIDQPLDYSDPIIQNDINKLLDKSALSVVPELNESWLKYYLLFLKDPRALFLTHHYNTSTSQGFIDCLRKVFLKKIPFASRFVPDIVFNENFTEIVASRFFIQLVGIKESTTARESLHYLRSYGAGFPYRIIFFHFSDPGLEILDSILWFVLPLIGILSLAILFFTLLFISNIALSLILGVVILVWLLGMLASFTLWNIGLNPPSSLAYLLCIGIGVKYFVTLLASMYSPISPLVYNISTSFAFLLGFLATFLVKTFILITDKLIFLTFLNIFLYMILFITPLFVYLNLCKIPSLKEFLKATFNRFRKLKSMEG